MSREATIARTFVQLADSLVAEFDVVEVLTVLADRCVSLLDVDTAGLMLAGPEGHLRVIASSSEQMRIVELFEIQADEGPCLDTWRGGVAVVDQVLADSQARWPVFAPVALEHGFAVVHALPMRLRGAVIGALNLFNHDARPLPASDADVAQALADVATIAVLQHRAAIQAQVLNDQLNHALNSRIFIEQAKGIVAAHLGLDMEQSFAHLRGYARSHNRRLVEVAQEVIAGVLAPTALRG